MTPMFIITGSMIMPAISPGWASRIRRTASSRPNGTTWVEAASVVDDRDVFGNRAGPVGRPGVVGLRVDRHLHRVVVAVVAALDLDDPLAPGRGPHQVQGGHRGLGAGVGETPQRQPEAAGQLDRDGDDVGHRLGEVGADARPAGSRPRRSPGGRGRPPSCRSQRAGRRTRCRRRPTPAGPCRG